MNVTVVGAGVIGMTTAIVFQRAGHSVRIIGEKRGIDATSGAAGAVWLPVRIEPGGREFGWAMRSYRVLREIARDHREAGVDELTACEVVEGDDERPWWADAVDGLAFIDAKPLYARAKTAWTFIAPRCEPALYLPWLEEQLEQPIVHTRIDDLSTVAGDLVLNCTGLGARRLCNDTELTGVLGQTVMVEPGTLRTDTFIGDERAASCEP